MEYHFQVSHQNLEYEKRRNHTKMLRTLLKKLKNTELVVGLLLQRNIISFNEKDNILWPRTAYEQNLTLVDTIIKKDWSRISNTFNQILSQTGNDDCRTDKNERKTKLVSSGIQQHSAVGVFPYKVANVQPSFLVFLKDQQGYLKNYLLRHKLLLATIVLVNIISWTLCVSVSYFCIILAILMLSIIASVLLKQVQLVNYLFCLFINALSLTIFEFFLKYYQLTDIVLRFILLAPNILFVLISNELIKCKVLRNGEIFESPGIYINDVDFLKSADKEVADKKCKKAYPKWWPDEKMLPLSFVERKTYYNMHLADEMFEHLQGHNCNNGSLEQNFVGHKIAISGLGGTGKTTAAIWYAKNFYSKYDKFFWIDSGEQGLFNSIKNLLREHLSVSVHHQIDVDLHQLKYYAHEFYNDISKRKCLMIFDNAESYLGIKDLLPLQLLSNIHVIITSRSNHWGNVHGKIKTLKLGTFSKRESIDFLTRFLLKDKVEWKKWELTALSESLGHLPLALQLSVAFLNNTDNYTDTMNHYIQKIKESNFIIEPSNFNLDDYPRSLCQAMGVSLELIKTYGETGDLAYKMLVTMSYIQPDDIEIEFLKTTENVKMGQAIYAVDLLESHSLITRTKKALRYDIEKENVISIHRLLQRVIRSRDMNTKDQTLFKIFRCKGFLEYKLIPYGFAYSNTNQFESIRNELVNHLNLKDLLIAFRFTEAVQLSKMIYEYFLVDTNASTSNKMSSKFNYAICLGKTVDNANQAVEIFESLCKDLVKDTGVTDSGVLHLLDLGIHYTGLMPNKLEIIFWLLRLNLMFHLQNVRLKMPILLRAIENLEHITITESECPVLLNLLTAIRNVELVSTTVEILENHEMLTKLPKRTKKLKLSNVKFVDDYGNVKSSILLKAFPFTSLIEMDIKCSKGTRIILYIQTLPSKLTKLNIYQPKFKDTLQFYYPNYIKSLNMFVSSDSEIDNLTLNCNALNKLELTCEELYNIELKYIPMTVRNLKFRNVHFSGIHDQRKRNFDKVILLYYDLDDVVELLNLITPTTFILEMATEQLSKLQGREVERFLYIEKLVLGLWDWEKLDFKKFQFLDYGVVKEQCIGVCFENRIAREISFTDFMQQTHLDKN